MTLDQLRIFVAVAEQEHLTRAAASLRLAPSAVSAAVRALEQRHGIALFDRIGRRIALTEIGRVFLDEAHAVIARAERAENRLAELAGRIAGVIRIEASLTIAAHWLPARLVAFRRDHPAVEVEVVVANTAHVARSVAEGVADVGFVEGECDGPSLRTRTVARDRLMLVGPPSVEATVEDLADLLRRAWVMREPGSGTRSEFEAELVRRGFDPHLPNVALTLPSNEAVMAAVAAGGGITALSALVAGPAVAAGRLRVIDPAFVERPFQLLRRADRSSSGAVGAFLAFLESGRGSSAPGEADRPELPPQA
jgi:DNA-binding transcriptional LysR family regulator